MTGSAAPRARIPALTEGTVRVTTATMTSTTVEKCRVLSYCACRVTSKMASISGAAKVCSRLKRTAKAIGACAS
nr:hypothetical protein [Deltaproteobacteria bacterium]